MAAAVKETHAPHRFLDELLEAELVARDDRRAAARTRARRSAPSSRSAQRMELREREAEREKAPRRMRRLRRDRKVREAFCAL